MDASVLLLGTGRFWPGFPGNLLIGPAPDDYRTLRLKTHASGKDAEHCRLSLFASCSEADSEV